MDLEQLEKDMKKWLGDQEKQLTRDTRALTTIQQGRGEAVGVSLSLGDLAAAGNEALTKLTSG